MINVKNVYSVIIMKYIFSTIHYDSLEVKAYSKFFVYFLFYYRLQDRYLYNFFTRK